MIILAIDPGWSGTGWAVIAGPPIDRQTVCESGHFTPRDLDHARAELLEVSSLRTKLQGGEDGN